MALVSILIPCYNAERWLSETLDSALAQTWADKEIIAVDDGSTDATSSILRRYAERGVRVIEQANSGQSAAFNRAIAAAKGDFYEFLDADDILAPDKIAVQMRRLASEPPNTMASGRWGRFYDRIENTDFRPDELWMDLEPVEWLVRAWTANAMMHGAAYLIPATLVQATGGWRDELSLINDFEFFSRLMLNSPRIVFCPDATSYYRSGVPGSLSGSKSARAWHSAFRSMEIGTSRLLTREDSARTRHACAVVWRTFVHDSYPAVPDLERTAIRRIEELGETLGSPQWGPNFRRVARLLGWRRARRLQLIALALRKRLKSNRVFLTHPPHDQGPFRGDAL